MFQGFFAVLQTKFKAIAAFALVQYESRHVEMQQFIEALDEVCCSILRVMTVMTFHGRARAPTDMREPC